jgi:hypothetical protein
LRYEKDFVIEQKLGEAVRLIMETPPFHLTDTDRATLAITDEEFVPETWHGVRNAIGTHTLR